MERIPYPANYFDPHGDDPIRGQCRECGEYFDAEDLTDKDSYPDADGSMIYVGTCFECGDD